MRPFRSQDAASRRARAVGTVLVVLASFTASRAQDAPAQGGVPDELAEPAPEVALDPPELPDLTAVACADCHRETAAEWARTAHALAWLDRDYQAVLAERSRPELCAGCHVPEPLLATGELPRQPKPREDASEPRAHGITCATCHVGADGVVLGPKGAQTDAHATEASPFQTAERSAELCAACHRTNIGPVIGIAKDYPDSAAARAGFTCVDCHMRPVERAWANLPDGEADPDLEPHVGRSHAIQTPRDPAFLRLAFDLTWTTRDGRTMVTVRNRAGHRVPGLVGRTISFEFETDGGAQAELSFDTRSYLPVDGEREVELEGLAGEVRVRARHLDPRAEAALVFLEGDVRKAE